MADFFLSPEKPVEFSKISISGRFWREEDLRSDEWETADSWREVFHEAAGDAIFLINKVYFSLS